MPRLRQAVLVARDLEPVAAELRSVLGLGEPFHDPNVSAFGLRNAVMALGDTFVEVVSPVADGTAAGRHLERRGGDGGYMVMFELDDVESARRRAAEADIREVFAVELPDIVDVHLHPRDVGGAIVALDRPSPAGSWRWGGPAWEGAIPPFGPGRVCGATIHAEDPPAMAERWAHVLGLPVASDGTSVVLDDGGTVVFAEPSDGRGEGVAGFEVRLDPSRPAPGPDADVAGVRLTFA